MRRFFVIAALAVIVAFGFGIAIGSSDVGPGHHSHSEVVSTANGGTVVIEHDRGFFPFPFLIFPLLFIGFFLFAGNRRRGFGCGPGEFGDREERLKAWHDAAHGSQAPPQSPA
jgi:hypothetical protein